MAAILRTNSRSNSNETQYNNIYKRIFKSYSGKKLFMNYELKAVIGSAPQIRVKSRNFLKFEKRYSK